MDATIFQTRVRDLGCLEPKEIVLAADYARPEHAHPYDAHVLVLEGEFRVTTADAQWVLKAGDDLVLATGTVHSEGVGGMGARLIVAAVYRS